MKRITYAKEPTLHVHRYIVTVYYKGRASFHYCVNKNEVQDVKDAARVGSTIEVYHATHNFKEAFEKDVASKKQKKKGKK